MDRAHAVVRDVAKRHGISFARIIGQARDRRTARVRFEAYHELRALGLSLPQIGRACGGRHHTTVLAGLTSKWTVWPAPGVSRAELVSAGAGL